SDDYYEKDTLYKVGAAFSDPTTHVLCGRSRIFQHKTNTTVTLSSGTDVYLDNLAKTIGWARIDQPETFFRKSVIDQVGPLNTQLNYLMDRDWWIRYLSLFGLSGIHQIEDLLVHFRLHDASKTVSQQAAFEQEKYSYFYALAVAAGYTQLGDFLATEAPQVKLLNLETHPLLTNKDLLYKSLHYFLLLYAEELYVQNAFKQARKFLKQIDSSALVSVDQKVIKKLQHRMRFPTWLIQLLRK
ncbi:MAG: hypothetical protein AAF734_02910, partial [Bacteroidota bacterium]